MIDVNAKAIAVLSRFVETAFAASAQDRGRLHRAEWETASGRFSVLGEIEVISDAVIGVARTCAKRCPKNPSEMIEILEAKSVHHSRVVTSWIASSGADYAELMAFVAAVESLRVATLAFFERA